MANVNEAIALVSLDDAKEYLQITKDTEDSILGDLINAASEFAFRWTGRRFLQATYTEVYEGNGEMELFLRNYPLISVASVNDDPTLPPIWGSGTLIAPADYYLDQEVGSLRRYLLPFFCKSRVKIVYDAGYTYATIPSDLSLAIKKLILLEWKTKYTDTSRVGVKSVAQGDKTTTFIEDEVPKDIAGVFNRYKALGWADRGNAV